LFPREAAWRPFGGQFLRENREFIVMVRL
jgi:hypothetical protein